MNAQPGGRRRYLLLYLAGGLIVVGALVASLALASMRRRQAARESSRLTEVLREGPLVRLASVETAPPARTITLSGEVHPYRRATLYAKISGYLRLIRVDKGERVKAGDVLGVIEAPEVEQQVLSQRASLAIKKLTDARYRALSPTGAVSQQEKDQASADVDIANAELARLNALHGYQVIRAPFSGVITGRYADRGALLQAATSSQSALALVDIADVDRVRVFVYLGQGEALFVHEGDPVTIWTEQRPENRIKATVTRFTKELDPRTRTMLTEIELDNKEAGLYPGTFVRVSLTVAAPPTLGVPAEALVFRAGRPMVARVREGHAALVPIEVGDTDGRLVRVRAGLDKDDAVVLHPADDIVDGVRVQVAAQNTSALR